MKAALIAVLLAGAGLANAAPSANDPRPTAPSVEVDEQGVPLLFAEDACPTCGYGDL